MAGESEGTDSARAGAIEAALSTATGTIAQMRAQLKLFSDRVLYHVEERAEGLLIGDREVGERLAIEAYPRLL